MKSLRRVLFWLHLISGLAAGLVILVMAATGVLLSFERQIIESADTPTLPASSVSAPRLSIEQLLEKAQGAAPSGSSITALTLTNSASSPAAVAYGRDVNSYLDPVTGQSLEPAAPGLRKFFRTLTEVHRAFALPGDSRNTGRAVTGASNLAFLFLVVSGLFLWFPRKWSLTALRPSLWFRRKLSGRARDWNWHNVLGFWSFLPLFFIVLTGVLISYPWATNLLYRLTGSETPPSIAQSGGPPLRPAAPSTVPSFNGLNAAWAKTEELAADWQSISLRLPAAQEAAFTVMAGHRGRPDLRSTITLDPQNPAREPKIESFGAYNTGRKLRTWGRWIHTGEAGGPIGQIIAAIVSAASVVLVWTGFALAIRRSMAMLRRRGANRTV